MSIADQSEEKLHFITSQLRLSKRKIVCIFILLYIFTYIAGIARATKIQKKKEKKQIIQTQCEYNGVLFKRVCGWTAEIQFYFQNGRVCQYNEHSRSIFLFQNILRTQTHTGFIHAYPKLCEPHRFTKSHIFSTAQRCAIQHQQHARFMWGAQTHTHKPQ